MQNQNEIIFSVQPDQSQTEGGNSSSCWFLLCSPLTGSTGMLHAQENWGIRAEFFKPAFFLQPGAAGHPLCSACAGVHHHLPREMEPNVQRAAGAWLQRRLCLWLQTALQTQGEVGAPRTLCQPRTCKSFMLSQQLAAVTQNRSSKWARSPPGFLLIYSPRTRRSSSSLPGHTMTLRSRVCSNQSQVFLVLGRVEVINWPFPSPATISNI